MNRKLASILLCLAMVFSSISFAAASSFTDVGTGELATATAVLQGMGVVSGTGASSFQPDNTLTRAEACTMLVKMMGLDSNLTSGAKKTYFSDVPAGSWYAAYVNIAYSNGLVNGYGNGKFGPADPVTYGQLATIVLRMLGYESADVGYVWPSDYTSLCEDIGISEDFTIGDNTPLTRGHAALMLYRSLTCKTKDGGQEYYQSVADVASTQDVIVMSVDASHNGVSGLLLAYGLSASGQGAGTAQTSDETYYRQHDVQSSFLQGACGTLLLDSSDRVVGFLPDEDCTYADSVISSATLSSLITTNAKYRVSASVVVLDETQTYAWSSGGYLHAAAAQGSPVRVYYDNDGTVTYIYIGTAAASSTAAAAAGITGSGSSGSGYTRYADYRVSGYIEAASPSLSAADSITVAGCSFSVLEDAVEDLSAYKIGSKVTLLLSDSLKVAGVKSGSEDMTGVLSVDGKSVTLCRSGVKLSASEMKYDSQLPGQLVVVYASSYGTLTCKELPANEVSGSLTTGAELSASVAGETGSGTSGASGTAKVGSVALAPSCDIYEWTGAGYVFSLEGVRGEASHDFSAIYWTDTVPASQISWCHVNSSGLIDVVLLDGVTGNSCSYGSLEYYTGNEGINLGSGSLSAFNNAAQLTNGSENGSKSLCTCSTVSGYVGVGYGSYGMYSEIVSVEKLKKTSAKGLASCSITEDENGDDVWQISDGSVTYRLSDSVEVYYEATDTWASGVSALTAALDSGYTATLYYDRTAATGGKVRVAVIN